MPLFGGLFGGQRLGNAHGSITIDTSGAERAQLTMRRVGQTIKRSFDNLERNTKTFREEIKKVNQELTALGVVGGIISAMGIRAAASFEEAQVQLVGMTGSLEAATKLSEELRERAGEAGLPFADLLAASKQLLPTMEGNTEELGKWLDLTRRVAVLNQQEGITGAAFAINEALTSGGTDLISLTERFNISRVQLREALEQTGGDFAAALDMVLTRMGITQKTAEEMGRTFNASFRAAKDAAVQLLAEGFEPILDILTPLLQRTATWLSRLREEAPGVATIGAALASIAAVGAPTLLFLNQIITSLIRIQKLKAYATLGPMLGGAAVLGGAAFTGARIGVGVARGIGRATGNEQLANATIRDAWMAFRQLIFIVQSALSKFGAEMAKVLAQGAAWLLNGFANVADALAMFVQRILDLIPGPDIGALGQMREWSEAAQQSADGARKLADTLANSAEGIDQKRAEFLMGLGRFLGVLPQAAQDLVAGARDAGQAAARGGRFTSEQEEAIADWAEQVQEIERSANEQRLSTTAQYEQQRADIIRSYEQTIAREAEDFARQRARQAAQLAASIAEIRESAAERERQWQRDLNARIADIRAEGNRRIAEIEEEGQRNLERMRRDHQVRLMEAAAMLDARAVAEEQRRFQGQISEAETDLQRRVEAERENLQERIDQERAAHRERVQAARAADAQRIQDMQEALAEQQELEDEDRAIRLKRMQEDHKAQLDEMADAQRERLEQIRRGALEERRTAWQGLLKRLDDMGVYNQAWTTLQERRQNESLALFDQYWDAWNARMSTLSTTETATGTGTPMLTRQAGGPVYGTGAAMLHGSRSRPEYVLSAETTSLLRGALGGSFTQGQLVGAVAGGGRSVTIQSGAFSMPIYAAPGQSPTDIARQVEQTLTNFFRRLTE